MKKRLNVNGMTCAACQRAVEKAASNVNGVKECSVNLLNNNMDIEYDDKICTLDNIKEAVKKAGYEIPDEKEKVKNNRNHKELINLIISFVFLLLIMYVSMGHMMWGFPIFSVFDMHKNPMGFALIQFILTIPVVFIYRRYFISGFTKLIKRHPNMDSLIAMRKWY